MVLREAWDRGIVLGGASAGSLCWFEEGTTDSRPKELSIVKCLGFLKGSHSPHYDAEPGRRPLYHKLIGSGEMKPGYACDNDAGIYFEDNEVKRVVRHARGAKVYHVSVVDGTVGGTRDGARSYRADHRWFVRHGGAFRCADPRSSRGLSVARGAAFPLRRAALRPPPSALRTPPSAHGCARPVLHAAPLRRG